MPPNEHQFPSAVQTVPSFLEAAARLIGCLDGPGDLSTNPKYFEGFGRDRQTMFIEVNAIDPANDSAIDPVIAAL
jgi:hypothetical protein